MTNRIVNAQLTAVLALINETTGHSTEAWTKDETGRWTANVGTYVLDWAYGGVRLCQLCNEGGGQRDITRRGTKRETYNQMRAFLAGLEAPAPTPTPTQYDAEDLPGLGWLVFTEHGEENSYFTLADGSIGFIKC